jgi:hypothetical protein
MPRSELDQVRAELRVARQHAHRTDAERAEAEARYHQAKAEAERASARAARTHAEAVTTTAALAQVRRLCDMTISDSIRSDAIQQAHDTLAAINAITGNEPLPGDAAWHSVWLHGNWRWLTKNMTTPEREHAADAVARYSDYLTNEDPDLGPAGEPEDLRWWRD